MKNILTIFISLFTITLTNLSSDKTSFTMQAEVEKSANVNLDKVFVQTFIKDINIYPKFFPDVVSVTRLNDNSSDWLYQVKTPMAPTYNLQFIMREDYSAADIILFKTDDTCRDFLFSKATFTTISEEQTNVKLVFKIKMTRDKPSDIHFMAGLLGEKFLSERMKDKLESDIDSFISKVTREMYIVSRSSSGK